MKVLPENKRQKFAVLIRTLHLNRNLRESPNVAELETSTVVQFHERNFESALTGSFGSPLKTLPALQASGMKLKSSLYFYDTIN